MWGIAGTPLNVRQPVVIGTQGEHRVRSFATRLPLSVVAAAGSLCPSRAAPAHAVERCVRVCSLPPKSGGRAGHFHEERGCGSWSCCRNSTRLLGCASDNVPPGILSAGERRAVAGAPPVSRVPFSRSLERALQHHPAGLADGAEQQEAFFHHDHKGNGYVGNVWACAFTSVPARS